MEEGTTTAKYLCKEGECGMSENNTTTCCRFCKVKNTCESVCIFIETVEDEEDVLNCENAIVVEKF